MTEKLEALIGRFWTSLEELKEEIYKLGFWIDDYVEELFLVFSDEEGWDDTEWILHLVSAGTTYAIKKIDVI